MKLVLSVSHKDLRQALKQMAWIGFLSERDGNSMLDESLLLVISRRASNYEDFKRLVWLGSKIFGECRCHVPDTEHEVGWPGSANFMFKESLEHVEKHFPDDIFFLEPDGMPLVPDWWRRINEEWDVAQGLQKPFMGAYVHHSTPHMTGIAAYSKDWRQYVAHLASCPDHDAFDTHAGSAIMPLAHWVHLIQHVFRRHEKGWEVPSLGILDKRAVIFHQDKRGKLIALIDQHIYQGACSEHGLFGYEHLFQPNIVMTKFYYTQNATKSYSVGDHRFAFTPLEAFGGSVPGVLDLEDEERQIAISELTGNPTTGITELTMEEWENVTKKKWLPQLSSTSGPLKPSPPLMPNAAILPVPSRSPAAVVVEGPSSSPSIEGPAQIENIEDVLKTAPVEPSQAPASNRPRRKK